MLLSGVQSWSEERGRALKGNPGVVKTERALYEMRYDLPRSAGEAASRLRDSAGKREGFLTATRAELITARGFRQQEIDDLDRSPKLPRGQTHDRSALVQSPNPLNP
jgi:hypothetical protein